jgi:monofunctional glycosyltransferase
LRLLALVLAMFVGASLLLVLPLRWVDPPYSAVMLQRAWTQQAWPRRQWTDIERIGPTVALAVIAAEDQRFPTHWGFDGREIVAALERRLDGGPLRGASTISQQVARNLFLWQGRSFVRKGLEAWFTVLIEIAWPKRRILELYLNLAETGPGRFGVTLASLDAFGRPPARLDAAQAALIAASLPNPHRYRVEQPDGYLLERRDWIMRQMRNLGGTAYLAGLLEDSGPR